MNLYIRNLQELQQLRASISSIFIGVILYNANEHKILVIRESDKQKSRFPGGGVEVADDFKHILADLRDKGLLRNINAFLDILKRAAKRELKEEISLDIDETQLTFFSGLITEDEKGEGRHLKAFFRYPLPKNLLPEASVSNAEEEKLVGFNSITAVYDPAKNFIHLDLFILLSKDHFNALKEGARNGKL